MPYLARDRWVSWPHRSAQAPATTSISTSGTIASAACRPAFDFDGLEIERYYHFICKTDYPLFELLAELDLSDKLQWTDTKMGFF